MQGNSPNEKASAVEAIFSGALILSAAERAAFVAEKCGKDFQLRERVEALLRAHEKAEGFLPEQARGSLEPTVMQRGTPVLPATEQPGDSIGRYKLLEKIGEGGFGVVYVAEQREPVRRRVALKIIKLGMDTRQVVARFEAERQALAMMDHPNIAKVLDAGALENGRPYFVMELVRGVKITDFCDQAKLSTNERLGLFVLVCQAVQHAHQKGIIHRDLKPSNIMVTLHDGVPVPKVIDFGIAKATQGQLTDKTVYTQFEQFIGTPAYMSPEQAEMSGLDIDTRGDIYSLGVLLYELLTGKTPFDQKEMLKNGLDEMRRIIREQEPVRPSTRLGTMEQGQLTTAAARRQVDPPKLLHAVRGDLDWIVMKCLEKERGRRYETANGLAMDIQRHLRNEPVVARPASKLYRFQKVVRRNKLAFAAAGAVTLALLLGLGLSIWQAARARKAEANEKAARQVAELSSLQEARQRKLAEENARKASESEQTARHLLYAANLNLALLAWEGNNIGRLRQLLDWTGWYPERGFEWYYWQEQAHLALKTLRGEGVVSAVFSPDGERIVTGNTDKTSTVWDAATGKELLTLKGHSNYITSVAFSPEGQRIVTGSEDHTAKVWDAASGKELLTLTGHSDRVNSVAFSPDGRRIVTGSGDNTAKVWEAAGGKELLTLEGHRTPIFCVAYSPDGQRVVTGAWDGKVKVWEAASGRELFTLTGHSSCVRSVAFSPHGRRIVTGSEDHTARVWETATGRELLAFKGHGNQVISVAFSPDGQRIVSSSVDQTAKVWEAASGRELLTLKGQFNSVAFSPDGQRIVTGGWDTARVWDATGVREPLTLTGHGDMVNSVAFSPDGQRIVTGSFDTTAKVWEVASGKELLTLTGHSSWVRSVAFSPDGRRIVTGSQDNTAKVWEAASGKELLILRGHSDALNSVAFSPDGQRIVTGSEDHTAKVWHAASGKELLTLTGHSLGVRSVAFSPDGQRIVTGSWDNTAKVWDAASGKELLTLKGHYAAIFSVAFAPDGQRIVTGCWDRMAKVWDAASGKELLTLEGHGGEIMSAAFSPDGQRIVTGSWDRTAKVWEAASGKELLTLQGHSATVCSVAFSPDGQRIVTASEDHTTKVWKAASPAQVAAWQAEEKAAAEHLTARRASPSPGN
jgi:WD40 repeat protein/serine/threonine protein kinase